VESSRLKQWLTRLAPIYPGEGTVVALCMGVSFLLVAGIMFGRNARDSLFLYYYGVQYLPYMYFANAIAVVACSLFYVSLVDRVARGKFLAGVSLLFVGCLIASRIILGTHPRWFFPVLYVEAQVIWIFSLMQLWTFAGDLFDTRQAKRLFPLIAVGSLLGMVGVGVFCKQIIRALGTENLLLIWAGLIFAAVILGGIVFRRYRRVVEPPAAEMQAAALRAKPSEWQKIKDGLRDVGREPLLRSMAGYVLLLWTVFAVVDFCYSSTVRLRFQNDPNGLTTFFGRFVGVQGFLCLMVQLFLTRSVIARLGVGSTINFHPAVLLLGTAWMSLRFGFASVVSTKLGDAIMLYTFSDSSYQLLYNPFSPDRRARVRGFLEGYVRPLSLAAAGGLLLVGNNLLKTLHWGGTAIVASQQLSWGACLLAITWLGFALTAKKGYIGALLQNLQAGSPALRQAAANALRKMEDPASLAIVADAVRGSSPERVVVAIHFLEHFPGDQANDSLVELLAHADGRVRATAASALGRRTGKRYVDRLTPLLSDPDPRVRANVVEALAAAEDPALVEKVQPLLTDASTRTRVNTVLTIAAIQGVSAAVESLPLIRELAHGDEKARSTATFALGRLPLDDSMDLLAELLNDSELRIRCEAAQALGRIGTLPAIPALIEALAGPPELRHDVRRSLAAVLKKCGAPCIQEMAETALHSERVEIRSELADVLGRLKDPLAIDPLVKLLKDPEWRVRWKVLKSFEKVARDLTLPENARAALFDYAHSELGAFRQSLLASQALVPQPASDAERLLALALEEDRLNIQERVFHMLGILCGRDRMLTVFQKLQSKDSRLRADALEALETLAPKVVAREVLGLLEPAPASKGAAAAPAPPLLKALASHSKPWVRACTAYYVGDHPQGDGENLLKLLLSDRAPLVRETALYAGWKRFGDSWRTQLEAASESSDVFLAQAARRIRARATSGNGKSSRPTERDQAVLLSIEKVLFLKSAPLFAAIEGEELAALADIALEHVFQPGEIIFEENQAPHHLYVIVQGKVEVFRRVDSKERSLAYLGEKECFGEMAILDDQPRSASVRAVEPTTVLKIDRESFRELILERPHIAFAIFRILSGRLRHQNLEADHSPAVYSGGQYG
jgi:HEAT repeat protein/ATP/ADP translocase